jgi:hypothetical protein
VEHSGHGAESGGCGQKATDGSTPSAALGDVLRARSCRKPNPGAILSLPPKYPFDALGFDVEYRRIRERVDSVDLNDVVVNG